MARLSFSLLFTSFLVFSPVQAAGLKFLQLPDNQDGTSIEAAVWSPCDEPAQDMQIRAFTIPAARDCPITKEGLPLIIFSHGYGGWYLGHHDTAEALADSGFIVVAINHPQANYADMSRANGIPALVKRPRDIKTTIDFMLSGFADAEKVDPQRIGFYGFSQGGFTGLVIAGAAPDFSKLPPRCTGSETVGCEGGKAHPRSVGQALTRDPRVKAMVISDPLSVVFQTESSVKDITIPVQLWQSEHGGGAGASAQDVSLLRDVLLGKPDFRIATNAIHLSFLTMCPQARMSSEVCRDAPGFDRASFHKTFNAEIVAFFQKHLAQ